MLTYGSVCSGIEAASVAWSPLGWTPAFFAEIEAFPSSVLTHRFPNVPNLGDFTAIDPEAWAHIDLLVGGTPCQAFSIAGLRRSLDDERGNLTLAFVRLADAIDDIRRHRGQPGLVVVWENVPGVLNTRDNAFGCFLAALVGADAPLVPGRGQRWTDAGLVAGPRRAAAWRKLDAQYFRLAQRRERVFVIASPRDGADPSAILFEPEGVRRHHPPRRGQGQGAAVGTVGGTSPGGGWRLGADEAAAGHLVAFGGNNTTGPIDIATACNAKGGAGRMDFESETLCVTGQITHTLTSEGFDASENGTGAGTPIVPAIADTLTAHWANSKGAKAGNQVGMLNPIIYPIGVRRLMPIEVERLQGFPDGWTHIPYRNRPSADGPRYRACGNSMAVPVMAWIGRRIDAALMRASAC